MENKATEGPISYESGQFGTWLIVHEDGRDILVQTDSDHPGLASTFGWVPCECGETDGTVDCAHRTATDMIEDAADYLRENEGATAEDPGYFD